MGNEMGNNNTTGLKEEEKLTVVEDPKGFLSKEILTHSVDDGVTHENHTVQGKDKEDNREESERSDDHSKEASLTIKEVEDENLIELNIDDEIVPGATENQLQTQPDLLINKEEKDITDSSLDPASSISSSSSSSSSPQHDIQEAEKLQSENDDELSLPDTVGSSGGTEQTISTLAQPAETEALEGIEARVDSESAAISESLVEHEINDAEEEKGLSEDDMFVGGPSNDSSDVGGKIDEESLESGQEIVSAATNSPNESRHEIHGTEEKISVLPEENGLELARESEAEDSEALQSERTTVEPKDTVISPCIDFESNKESDDHEDIAVIGPCNEFESNKESEDHKDIAVIDPQVVTVSSESKIADCIDEKDDSSEKKIVEEIETLCAVEIDDLPLVPSVQSATVQAEAKKDDDSGESSRSDIKQCIEKPDNEATPLVSSRESVERLSTDSERDGIMMRKSPSFSIDLRDEAKNEESEETPLLYQDKAEIQSEVIVLGNTSTITAAEERVVALERSDSEKSKAPFLELSRTVAEPTNVASSSSVKVTISSTYSSSRGKEKRKVRSSLFGTCLCCATLTN